MDTKQILHKNTEVEGIGQGLFLCIFRRNRCVPSVCRKLAMAAQMRKEVTVLIASTAQNWVAKEDPPNSLKLF